MACLRSSAQRFFSSQIDLAQAGAPPRGDGQPHRVGNYNTGARAEVPQSRFKGVYFVLGGRWEAKITYRSKSKHIGTFDSEEEAARAFDARARYLGVPERCNYDDCGKQCKATSCRLGAFYQVTRSWIKLPSPFVAFDVRATSGGQ